MQMTYNYTLILSTMTSLYLCVWKGCAYVSLTFRNEANKLVMNDNKTEYIPFIPKRYDSLVATSSIRVRGYSIPASTHVTNLGVILDRHYTMSQQVSNNCTVVYLQIKTDQHHQNKVNKACCRTSSTRHGNK